MLSTVTSELKSSATPLKSWSAVVKGKDDNAMTRQKIATDHQIQALQDDEMQRLLADILCLSAPLKKSNYVCLNQTYHKVPPHKGKLKFRKMTAKN